MENEMNLDQIFMNYMNEMNLDQIFMDLDKAFFNEISALVERDFDKLMDAAVKQAEGDGYQVSFAGVYKQTIKVEGSSEMSVPFVVAQTAEQVAKLAEGFLEGRIYDAGELSSVEGKISPESVNFDICETFFLPRAQRRISVNSGSALGSEDLVIPPLNLNKIIYQGQSNDGGKTYSGTWSFNSETSYMIPKGWSFSKQKKV